MQCKNISCLYLNIKTYILTLAYDIVIIYIVTDANGSHHRPTRDFNHRLLFDDITCHGVKNLQGGNE